MVIGLGRRIGLEWYDYREWFVHVGVDSLSSELCDLGRADLVAPIYRQRRLGLWPPLLRLTLVPPHGGHSVAALTRIVPTGAGSGSALSIAGTAKIVAPIRQPKIPQLT